MFPPRKQIGPLKLARPIYLVSTVIINSLSQTAGAKKKVEPMFGREKLGRP